MDVIEQSKTHSDNDMSESAQNINLNLQIESRIDNSSKTGSGTISSRVPSICVGEKQCLSQRVLL